MNLDRRCKIRLEIELNINVDFGSEDDPKDSDVDEDITAAKNDVAHVLSALGTVEKVSVTVLERPPTIEQLRKMKEDQHGK